MASQGLKNTAEYFGSPEPSERKKARLLWPKEYKFPPRNAFESQPPSSFLPTPEAVPTIRAIPTPEAVPTPKEEKPALKILILCANNESITNKYYLQYLDNLEEGVNINNVEVSFVGEAINEEIRKQNKIFHATDIRSEAMLEETIRMGPFDYVYEEHCPKIPTIISTDAFKNICEAASDKTQGGKNAKFVTRKPPRNLEVMATTSKERMERVGFKLDREFDFTAVKKVKGENDIVMKKTMCVYAFE